MMRPWLDDGDVQLYQGDVVDVLDQLPGQSVQCVVTSPPYWGQRDYGPEGQLGLEPTFAEFLERMVDVFRAVRRVLREDGTCWVNMGDKYSSDKKWGGQSDTSRRRAVRDGHYPRHRLVSGVGNKNIVGQPWRLAFALQDDGWILRRDVIWHKPNAMPESVGDRPHTAHEYIFMLTKAEAYVYDRDAVRTPLKPETLRTWTQAPRAAADDGFSRSKAWGRGRQQRRYSVDEHGEPLGADLRSVWSIPTAPGKGNHVAPYPPDVVKPCILAGSRPGDVVLDPFMGSGTTAYVARQHGRRAIGIDLDPEALGEAADRLSQQSLLAGGIG